MSGPRNSELSSNVDEIVGKCLAVPLDGTLSKDIGVSGRTSVGPTALEETPPPEARDWIIASSFATRSLRFSRLSTVMACNCADLCSMHSNPLFLHVTQMEGSSVGYIQRFLRLRPKRKSAYAQSEVVLAHYTESNCVFLSALIWRTPLRVKVVLAASLHVLVRKPHSPNGGRRTGP